MGRPLEGMELRSDIELNHSIANKIDDKDFLLANGYLFDAFVDRPPDNNRLSDICCRW